MLFLVGYSHRTTRKTINSDPVPPSTRLAMQRIRKKVYTPSACSMDSQEKKRKALGLTWKTFLTSQLWSMESPSSPGSFTAEQPFSWTWEKDSLFSKMT